MPVDLDLLAAFALAGLVISIVEFEAGGFRQVVGEGVAPGGSDEPAQPEGDRLLPRLPASVRRSEQGLGRATSADPRRTFTIVGLLVDATIGVASGRVGARLNRSRRLRQFIDRLAAVVFVGLAVRLLADR